jgi:Flp pilus assembly protein TadG
METSLLNKRLQSECGQIILFLAILIVPILGMVGIAIDSGYLFYTRRAMQTAADSAALAGSLDKAYETSTSDTVEAAAKADAKQNGFEDGVDDVTISVNSPPTSSGFADNNYVEVIIERTKPTFFMNMLSLIGMTDLDTATVKALAIAGAGELDECIWATSTTGTGLTVGGAAQIDASGCGIYVRSSDTTTAMSAGGSVTVKTLDVVGGISGSSNVHATTLTNPANALPDPLATVSSPSLGTCSGSPNGVAITNTSSKSTPYCSLTITSGTLTANSTYYVEGNVTLNAQLKGSPTTITGDGVTIYVKTGTISLGGSGTVTLTAPTTGTYSGFVLFQGRSNANAVGIGTGAPTAGCKAINGIAYAPNAQINYNSTNCTTAPGTILVAKTINVGAHAQFGNPTTHVRRRGHSHIFR